MAQRASGHKRPRDNTPALAEVAVAMAAAAEDRKAAEALNVVRTKESRLIREFQKMISQYLVTYGFADIARWCVLGYVGLNEYAPVESDFELSARDCQFAQTASAYAASDYWKGASFPLGTAPDMPLGVRTTTASEIGVVVIVVADKRDPTKRIAVLSSTVLKGDMCIYVIRDGVHVAAVGEHLRTRFHHKCGARVVSVRVSLSARADGVVSGVYRISVEDDASTLVTAVPPEYERMHYIGHGYHISQDHEPGTSAAPMLYTRILHLPRQPRLGTAAHPIVNPDAGVHSTCTQMECTKSGVFVLHRHPGRDTLMYSDIEWKEYEKAEPPAVSPLDRHYPELVWRWGVSLPFSTARDTSMLVDPDGGCLALIVRGAAGENFRNFHLMLDPLSRLVPFEK